MADEEDFDLDIDIYGDDKPPEPTPKQVVEVEAASASDKNPQPGPPVDLEAEAPVGPAQDVSMQHSVRDDRPVDAGATSAIRLGELEWWTTEEDIRGWANDAGAEEELVEVTFNEHKINGKSKGEAFVEFTSPQAATAMRQQIAQLSEKQPKKISATFAEQEQNPFKSHVKDAASRNRETSIDGQQNSYQNANRGGYNYNQTGYRGGGGRGGFARGGYQARGGYNNNFGYDNSGFNRGGFYGRGGRGGMMGGMMGMMGNMMGMPMGMGGGMGFGGFPQGQYGQNQQQTYDMSNPHGMKRPRPEGQ